MRPGLITVEHSWPNGFGMLAGETLAGLLEEYEQVTCRTDELVATVPDLDISQPLPEAAWFEPEARWSARRVLLHVIAETAQHAGHDIIRESLDGAKSMGSAASGWATYAADIAHCNVGTDKETTL